MPDADRKPVEHKPFSYVSLKDGKTYTGAAAGKMYRSERPMRAAALEKAALAELAAQKTAPKGK